MINFKFEVDIEGEGYEDGVAQMQSLLNKMQEVINGMDRDLKEARLKEARLREEYVWFPHENERIYFVQFDHVWSYLNMRYTANRGFLLTEGYMVRTEEEAIKMCEERNVDFQDGDKVFVVVRPGDNEEANLGSMIWRDSRIHQRMKSEGRVFSNMEMGEKEVKRINDTKKRR